MLKRRIRIPFPTEQILSKEKYTREILEALNMNREGQTQYTVEVLKNQLSREILRQLDLKEAYDDINDKAGVVINEDFYPYGVSLSQNAYLNLAKHLGVFSRDIKLLIEWSQENRTI